MANVVTVVEVSSNSPLASTSSTKDAVKINEPNGNHQMHCNSVFSMILTSSCTAFAFSASHLMVALPTLDS
jgi:hypothetical protein